MMKMKMKMTMMMMVMMTATHIASTSTVFHRILRTSRLYNLTRAFRYGCFWRRYRGRPLPWWRRWLG
jgi:hypothetical protein